MEYPAECTGVITSWNYCYYNTEPLNTSSTYTATFNVWRHNANEAFVVDNSDTMVTLNPGYSIASIFCKNHTLEPSDYFVIEKGDYVGVVLPSHNPISLIGHSMDNILVKYSSTDSQALPLTEGSHWLLIMHVYADIGEVLSEHCYQNY